MWPRPAPQDPDSPEVLFFVVTALVGLTLFYAFASYRVFKTQRPYFQMLAREVCDPGTGKAHFIWFPPQYAFEGRFHGHPIHFLASSTGRSTRTHLFLASAVRFDARVSRLTFRSLPGQLQRAFLPLVQRPGFSFGTIRSHRRLAIDGRPLVFGFQPGLHVAYDTTDLSALTIREEAEALLAAASAAD